MKKDIEWLKEKIKQQDIVMEKGYIRTGFLMSLIDKLDEPELLSQEENINIVLDDLKEHIKEQQVLSQSVGLAHTSAGNDTHYRQYDYVLECINEYEPSDYLKNLIEPKQELPLIPKFVGEFIEEVKASGDRLDDAFSILRGIYHQSKVADWVAKEKHNSETFARAWLDGYEVEEVRYHVRVPYCTVNYYYLDNGHTGAERLFEVDVNHSDFELTEDEIYKYLPGITKEYWEEVK